MFGFNPKMQRGKSPIAARTINVPSRQAQKSARLTVGPGLGMTHIDGIPVIRKDRESHYIVRITSVGTGGVYGWQAIEPDPATPGGWIDRDSRISGTDTDDPLREFNGNDALTVGTRVEAFRASRTGELRFQYDKCT